MEDSFKKILNIYPGWWFEPLWKILVNWDDEIPNIWENKIHVPNHQPVNIYQHRDLEISWISYDFFSLKIGGQIWSKRHPRCIRTPMILSNIRSSPGIFQGQVIAKGGQTSIPKNHQLNLQKCSENVDIFTSGFSEFWLNSQPSGAPVVLFSAWISMGTKALCQSLQTTMQSLP